MWQYQQGLNQTVPCNSQAFIKCEVDNCTARTGLCLAKADASPLMQESGKFGKRNKAEVVSSMLYVICTFLRANVDAPFSVGHLSVTIFMQTSNSTYINIKGFWQQLAFLLAFFFCSVSLLIPELKRLWGCVPPRKTLILVSCSPHGVLLTVCYFTQQHSWIGNLVSTVWQGCKAITGGSLPVLWCVFAVVSSGFYFPLYINILRNLDQYF